MENTSKKDEHYHEAENTMSNIKSFEEKVDYCRENLAPDLIENAAVDHALYLFKSLLSVAVSEKEPVRIVSGHLKSEFYDNLSDQLDQCIDAGVDIELLILNGNVHVNNSSFASKIDTYSHGKVYKAPKGYELNAQHMLLVGDRAERYRLETDHEQTKAVASFNGPSMGETLLSTYRQLKELLTNPPAFDSVKA